MRLPVTENGITLPREWFGNATEVEVRQENGHVRIEPVTPAAAVHSQVQPYDQDDPIWQLGKKTSDLEITDASVNLDKYLYGDLGSR
jgi:hypothetical protein